MKTQQHDNTQAILDELVTQARAALQDDLLSVILFGSAAEDRLRPLSDVNLIFYLRNFAPERVNALRESLRTCHAAIQTSVMFLLQQELPLAAQLFALKFNDIRVRHRVLWGEDPLASLQISDHELRRRACEVLLNLSIRVRERYALISLREEQLIPVIADSAAPLRAAALALLQLRGQAGELTPREALHQVIAQAANPGFQSILDAMPQVRQNLALPEGEAGPLLLRIGELASYLLECLMREETHA